MLVQYAPFTFALSQKLFASLAAQYPFAETAVLGRSVTKHGIFSLSVGKGEEQVLLLAGLSGKDSVQPLLLYRFSFPEKTAFSPCFYIAFLSGFAKAFKTMCPCAR